MPGGRRIAGPPGMAAVPDGIDGLLQLQQGGFIRLALVKEQVVAAFQRPEAADIELLIQHQRRLLLGVTGLAVVGNHHQRDVLGQMAFTPRIAHDLKTMDLRLFQEPPVGIVLPSRVRPMEACK